MPAALYCDLGDRRAALRVPHLASCRVYSGPMSPWELVSSYLTFSPLPITWRYISVALFLRLPWLDVIKCICSMMLGLSSPLMQPARLSSKLENILTHRANFVKVIKICFVCTFAILPCRQPPTSKHMSGLYSCDVLSHLV